MIAHVVFSCLNRNSHLGMLIDRSISEENRKRPLLEISGNIVLPVDIQIWNSSDV